MRFRLIVLVVAGALLPLALAADDVHLKNGRKFEGVIARLTPTKVRIQLPFGEISLPRQDVLRVEKEDSALEEYLRLEKEVRRKTDASAADWLELARWASANALEHSAREAALRAAVLEPQLEGLAGILRPMGYVLDEVMERWIPYAEYMRRTGFVFHDGQWISQRELTARREAEREARSRERASREASQSASLAQQIRTLTELELLRQARQPAYTGVYAVGVPVVDWGWFFPLAVPHHRPIHGVEPPPRGHPPADHGQLVQQRQHQRTVSRFLLRQPGSLIPATLPPARASGHRHR
jgi:hypothetical protein